MPMPIDFTTIAPVFMSHLRCLHMCGGFQGRGVGEKVGYAVGAVGAGVGIMSQTFAPFADVRPGVHAEQKSVAFSE